jgi:type III pantothenate kinase
MVSIIQDSPARNEATSILRTLLVVDCGHTSLKMGLARVESIHAVPELLDFRFLQLPEKSEPLSHETEDSELWFAPTSVLVLEEVRSFLHSVESAPSAVVLSVPAPLRTFMLRGLPAICGEIPFRLMTSQDLWPVGNGYATPQTLGTDRLAASTAALARMGGIAPVISLTVGTAITVNLVIPPIHPAAKSVLLGGAILPGYSAFLRGLSAAAPTLASAVTAVLAHPNWATSEFEKSHPALCGASTAGNLRRGAIEGVTAAVMKNVHSIENEHSIVPGECPVLVTGGDALTLATNWKLFAQGRPAPIVAEYLVLEGLALAYTELQLHPAPVELVGQ